MPFSREAVANAFVMLGLLPGARAEEILGQYQPELEAEGFRLGVLTGELSVVPGALGYHEARAASRADLTRDLAGRGLVGPGADRVRRHGSGAGLGDADAGRA